MSRKDYIEFARMIRAQVEKHQGPKGKHTLNVLREIAGDMTHMFTQDNARFDTERFLIACGFEVGNE